MPVLTYSSETMTWTEKERFRIRAVQMESLRGVLGIRRMDKTLNPWIRQLCRVTKGVDEKIDESVLRWFSHLERMSQAGQCRKRRKLCGREL